MELRWVMERRKFTREFIYAAFCGRSAGFSGQGAPQAPILPLGPSKEDRLEFSKAREVLRAAMCEGRDELDVLKLACGSLIKTCDLWIKNEFLDPRDDETPEAAKARYLENIEGCGVKFAALVDSGNGLQALVKLEAKIALGPLNGGNLFSEEDQGFQRKRSLLARRLSSPTRRFLDGTTHRPRTAPASPPTRSTRLAVQRRRRRCGRSMGSRVRIALSPREPLCVWTLCSPKSNNNAEALELF
jgi:hypothetical protein